jgi:hypothetical protein
MTRPTVICPTCEGEGTIWNNADPTSGMGFDCEACGGEGERAATDQEWSDMAEAYSIASAASPDEGMGRWGLAL